MKLVYGISRWTNSSRASAQHIDNGKGGPLCGGAGRKVSGWATEEGAIETCKASNLHEGARVLELVLESDIESEKRQDAL